MSLEVVTQVLKKLLACKWVVNLDGDLFITFHTRYVTFPKEQDVWNWYAFDLRCL